jgi:hypothetical protein
VLTHDPNRAEAVSWRPIMGDALIGVVADGSLTFPGLRHGQDFAAGIRTAHQLLAAARGPVTTTTVRIP